MNIRMITFHNNELSFLILLNNFPINWFFNVFYTIYSYLLVYY